MSSLSDWYNAPKSDRGANQTVSKPSSSSGGSSSNKKTPAPTSGGYMNTPVAGGTPPMPSSYQSGDVTYTPGPTNWDSMSQSQRDAYGSSLAGRNVSTPKPSSGRGPGGVIGSGGGWMDGQYYPPMPQQNNQNYKVTAGMGMGGTPPPMPATGGTTPFPVKTPEAIAAEAKARTDALLAKQTTIAGQTKTGFQTAYDRLAATTKDDRTLADAAFQRNTNPFSGGTGFQKDMTGRQREISDQQSKQDLQTRLANVDLSLADYTNATEAQRMQMETDMTNAERAYGLQVDQLALQRRGQEQSQLNADRQFNYGVGRDAVVDSRYNDTTQYNRGRDNVLDNRYVDTTNYSRGRDAQNDAITVDNTNYNRGRDRISDETKYNGIYNPSGLSYSQVTREFEDNSAAYANASPEQKQKLHERNLYLGSLIGKQYDTATGEYSQGNNFVGTQTIDSRNQQFNQDVTRDELAIRKESSALANDLAKLQLANYPEEQRLKIEQMKKQIDQIGKAPYQSRQDLEMDQIRLETAKLQYNQLKTGKSASPADIITELNKSTFVEYDEDTKRPVVYDAQGLGKAILSRTSDAKERAYLFSYYNIDPDKLLQSLNSGKP